MEFGDVYDQLEHHLERNTFGSNEYRFDSPVTVRLLANAGAWEICQTRQKDERAEAVESAIRNLDELAEHIAANPRVHHEMGTRGVMSKYITNNDVYIAVESRDYIQGLYPWSDIARHL